MVQIVSFDPDVHAVPWREFILCSYRDPRYVLLSPVYRRWQFLDNPANRTGAHTLWLVLHREAVVAQLGFVPFVGEAGDETFDGAYPINLIVHPDYRALGLGAILLSRLLRECPQIVNPGSSEAGATLCLGLGMRDLGHLHRHVAIIDPAVASRLAEGGVLPQGTSPVTRAREVARPHIAPVRRLPPSAPEAFRLPVRVRCARRDRAFFRWRYEDHPGFDYEFLLDPGSRNVLVFHEEREAASGTLLLRVVDLIADAEAAPVLIEAALEVARTRGAALVDFYCSLDVYDAALVKAGFFREADHTGGRIAALFQPLDFRKVGIRVLISDPGAQEEPVSSWYVTKADSDQDRPNDAERIERRAPSV